MTAEGSLAEIIEETVQRHVTANGRVTDIVSTPVGGGLSGTPVRRHTVTVEARRRDLTVSLITKHATGIERRVLDLLQAQKHSCIPYNHAIDRTDADALLCMEDLGDRTHPTSLDPIPPGLIQREADALAAIHHVNTGRPGDYSWLPHAGDEYLSAQLATIWEPAWERALEDAAFRHEFADAIDTVEAAAARAPAEIDRLWGDERCLSLLHGDINPSNVLLADGNPHFIDWQAACYGPCYLDLPHHLPTLRVAESYRLARAARGDTIAPDDFAVGFRAAAHYIGLRYLWWTLDLWLEDHSEDRWVRHYFSLVAL